MEAAAEATAWHKATRSHNPTTTATRRVQPNPLEECPPAGGPNITDRQERVVRIIGGERPIGYLGGHVDPYTNSDGGGGGVGRSSTGAWTDP